MTDYDKAYSYGLQTYQLAKEINYPYILVHIAGLLGYIKMNRGEYAESFNYLQHQLEISESLSEKLPSASAYLNLGNFFSKVEQPLKSLEFYEQGQRVYEDAGHIEGKASALINSSIVLSQLGRFDEALKKALHGLKLANKTENQYYKTWALGSIASAYMLGEIEKAFTYLQQHYSAALASKDRQQQLNALLNFGEYYFQVKDYDQALHHLKGAETLATDNNLRPDLYECYRRISKVLKVMGRFDQALTYYENHHKLKDEVLATETSDKIQWLEQRSKNAEAEVLRLKTVELERRVEERTKALTQLNIELNNSVSKEAELNLIQSQIIKTVSHEFRTPLASIRLYSDLLQRNNSQFDESKRARMFNKINQSILRLENTLQQTLEIGSRGDSFNDVRILLIDHPQFAKNLTDNLLSRFEQYEALLTIKHQPFIGDIYIAQLQVLQILNYLVDNALKFSDYGLPVIVETAIDEKENCFVATVCDQGIGIPKSGLKHVFQPLFRCDNARFYQGIGLGLFSAQQLVDKLGGKLEIVSGKKSNGIVTQMLFKVPLKSP